MQFDGNIIIVKKENYAELLKESRASRSYTVGVTQFSDLTHQEFKNTFLGRFSKNFLKLIISVKLFAAYY